MFVGEEEFVTDNEFLIDFKNGIGNKAMFESPRGITTDNKNILYVIANNEIKKVTFDGKITTLISDGENDSEKRLTSTYGLLNKPDGITIDKDGNLYITESGSRTIWKNDKVVYPDSGKRRIKKYSMTVKGKILIVSVKNRFKMPIKGIIFDLLSVQ